MPPPRARRPPDLAAGRAGRRRAAGPLEQANLHTLDALNKHVGLGLWFAAIAAGYAVDRFIAAAPAGRSRSLTSARPASSRWPSRRRCGISQSTPSPPTGPTRASFIAIFRPLADHGSGPLLVEDPSIAEYYLPLATTGSAGPPPATSSCPPGPTPASPAGRRRHRAPERRRVCPLHRRHYFSLVALNFADTTTLDHTIADAADRNPDYRIDPQVVPYGSRHGTYII